MFLADGLLDGIGLGDVSVTALALFFMGKIALEALKEKRQRDKREADGARDWDGTDRREPSPHHSQLAHLIVQVDDRVECLATEVSEIKEPIFRMKAQLHELHGWHDKEDADGRKIWYVKQSLEDSIRALNEAANTQTQAIVQQTRVLSDLHHLIAERMPPRN